MVSVTANPSAAKMLGLPAGAIGPLWEGSGSGKAASRRQVHTKCLDGPLLPGVGAPLACAVLRKTSWGLHVARLWDDCHHAAALWGHRTNTQCSMPVAGAVAGA